MEAKLEREYDEIFDGEEKSLNLMKIDSDKFTREVKRVKLKKIGLSEPIKKGRSNTMAGLTKSIKELGVVTPIHVMTVEDYDEEDEDDFEFVLLDGLRRMFGAMKNGLEEIDAVIWNFKDKEVGKQVSLSLSLILNRGQRRNWQEIWDLYKILELQYSITPGSLEYLLQLDGGDAMKLKDVMYCDYQEVIDTLISGEKDLDQCYKMLQKLRKEEDQLAKDDMTGITDTVEDGDEITSERAKSPSGTLTDDDVKDLLEMADSLVGAEEDLDSEDFDELNKVSGDAVTHQKTGERHPVDALIRQGTFKRDDYRCRCCGTGDVAFLGTLVYHHIIPVHSGGPDTIENGLTLCDSCHQTLHIAEKQGGKIQMTRSQFDAYDELQQRRIKKILKYAKIAVEASTRKGVDKKVVRDSATKSARHRMPGTGLQENVSGFGSYESSKSKEENSA